MDEDSMGMYILNTVIPTTFIGVLNIIQLLQCMSFIRYAPEAGEWHSSVHSFFDFCKHLALRFEDEAFLAMYFLSCVGCVVTLLGYLIFSKVIHRVNLNFSAFKIGLYFVEYVIFGFGFIPMVSAFVEVQICDSEFKIRSLNTVKCFSSEQLAMLMVGFFGVGIVFLMKSAVFPMLIHERRGIENLWGNESLAEGVYSLVMIACVTLFGFVEIPEVGIVLCIAALCYFMVFECYDSEAVASGRCGVMGGLIWGFAAAFVLKRNQSSGTKMLDAVPAAYFIAYLFRFVKTLAIPRKINYVPQ